MFGQHQKILIYVFVETLFLEVSLWTRLRPHEILRFSYLDFVRSVFLNANFRETYFA